MIDQHITPGFWLSEFITSDYATRHGLDNVPGVEEWRRIKTILAPGMQTVRDCLGAPVLITSGYRSPEVNKAVGGVSNSQHTQGLAADFKCPQVGMPRQVVQWILEHGHDVRWDQLIEEGTWVHVSFSQGTPRRQVLKARFSLSGTTYTPWNQ